MKALKAILTVTAAAASLFLLSCTVIEDGIDIESSVDVDACKESGSTNCVVDGQQSRLSMTIRSQNPIRPFSLEGDCFGAEAPKGLDPRPYDPTNPSPSANLYPVPAYANELLTTKPDPLYCFDVSGDCNEGSNATASVVLRSAPSFFDNINPEVIAECKRGRFKGQLAARFPIDGLGPGEQSSVCKRYTIELELVGKSINDEEERNPSQARSFVDILATSHSLCSE